MRNFIALTLCAASISGCHARFKKAAPTIDDINVQVITTGGPYVELGKVWGTPETNNPTVNLLMDVAAVAVNVSQEIKAIDQTTRIYNAVNIDDVNRSMTAGLGQTLGSGPPFAYSGGSDTDATLQLEVLSYGLYVPYLGAPGEFTYTVRARMYRGNGERVYKTNLTCEVGAGDPEAGEMVLGIVNNIRELNEMTDEEIWLIVGVFRFFTAVSARRAPATGCTRRCWRASWRWAER